VKRNAYNLSPIIQALREPAPLMINYCVISYNTGLGILSLENVINIGTAKPEIEILKFTKFGVSRISFTLKITLII